MTFVKYERKLIRTHQYINEEIILFTSQTVQLYYIIMYVFNHAIESHAAIQS